MPNFPKIDLTRFEVPTLPQVQLPEVRNVSAEQITDCARNVLYVSVGLVVTVVERVVDTAKAAAARVDAAGWPRLAA